MEKYKCCKCKWVGVFEEKLRAKSKTGWVFVCPRCGRDEFYVIKAKETA